MHEFKTKHFKCWYDNSAVRWVKTGDIEIVRMIYSAVRDHNWGTIEPEIIEEKVVENAKGFQIKTLVKYQKANIHFEAEYTIKGNENRLEFVMKGEAKSTFKTNRIGFCVLHPIAECAGKTCTVIHTDNTSVKAIFPQQISPEQPMKNISSLEWEPAKNIFAKLHFSGDVFEMEDQRNWTDASYKTYCRPLSLPFPFEIKNGEKIHQKIVMELECEPQNEKPEDFISLKIDENRKFKIPEIGVCSTSRVEKLTKNEAEILKQFSFSHLRAEIHLFKSAWKIELEKCIAESNLLELPLFLVIYFSDNFIAELENLKKSVNSFQVNVKYILMVGKNHLPDDDLFEKVYPEIKAIFPAAKIGAGVNAYFAELNRNRPQSAKAEFISFAVCPQIHAFDDFTLVENLEAQKYVVKSAKHLFPDKQIFVSPLTLKQRFNVVATSDEPEVETVELPPQVDVRQNSVFAAQWLLGSLKFMTQLGIDLVTYFETVGWRGFIQGDFDAWVPEKFLARKGDIFPLFQVINELIGYDEMIFSKSSHPLKVEGVILKNQLSGKTKILLCNYTNTPIKFKIKGLSTNRIGKSISSSVNTLDDECYEIQGNMIIKIYTV